VGGVKVISIRFFVISLIQVGPDQVLGGNSEQAAHGVENRLLRGMDECHCIVAGFVSRGHAAMWRSRTFKSTSMFPSAQPLGRALSSHTWQISAPICVARPLTFITALATL
jgi:hypothetical protein